MGCLVLRYPRRSQEQSAGRSFVVRCYFFSLGPTAVADVLGEGDKVVVELVA